MADIQVLNDLTPAALLVTLFFGTFVSEDGACLAAGAAAASGRIGLAAAIAACFLGIFAGDMLLYVTGRALGNRVFDNRIVHRFVSDNARSKASAWLDHNSASAVFLSRFVSGLRLPTYLAAGALRTDLKRFTAYFLLASAIWTPILVGTTAFSQLLVFGTNTIVGVIAVFVFVRLAVKYSSWKNRRLFVGRVKRITNSEFWPVYVFYVPVVLYVLLLAIRYRSLTVFTATNPPFPAGGFKGESKNDIYNALRMSPENKRFLLAHTLISGADSLSNKLRHAWQFMDRQDLAFPIVIKPDAGERGKDVRILRSFDELAAALDEMKGDAVLQEFAGGEEISVFYFHHPHEERGKIFSMTEKSFPVVIGDGRSTIEELVVRDRRAVCLAHKYFEELGDRVEQIPTIGQVVRLIDIGTHSRGGIFRDGEWLRTLALENTIDKICANIPGFFFGRFDIRARSFADLQCGRFKIIELNGVTSESTNIYDRRYSLLDAYRILFRQWRLAFEIGAANVERGARTTGILDLARLAMGMRPKIQVDSVRPPRAATDCV